MVFISYFCNTQHLTLLSSFGPSGFFTFLGVMKPVDEAHRRQSLYEKPFNINKL